VLDLLLEVVIVCAFSQVMRGNYRKIILDQGGAIVMIPTGATHPEITHIL